MMSDIRSIIFQEVNELFCLVNPFNLNVNEFASYCNEYTPILMEQLFPENETNNSEEEINQIIVNNNLEEVSIDLSRVINNNHLNQIRNFIFEKKEELFKKNLYYILKTYVDFFKSVKNDGVFVHQGFAYEKFEMINVFKYCLKMELKTEGFIIKEYDSFFTLQTTRSKLAPITLVFQNNIDFKVVSGFDKTDLPFNSESVFLEEIQLKKVSKDWLLVLPKKVQQSSLSDYDLPQTLRDLPCYNQSDKFELNLNSMLNKTPNLSLTFGVWTE